MAARGYHVAPQELAAQCTALAALGDQTGGLVTSAGRLAERLPQLGTAPPAMHLAMRLRAAADESGLTGEITAVDTELNSYHRALSATVRGYLADEEQLARTFDTVRKAE